MTIHRKVMKQRHKPFKNSKSKKAKIPQNPSQKTPVALGRKAKKVQIIAKNKALRASIREESPRNVFVIPFHENANPIEFITAALDFYSNHSPRQHNASKNGWFVSDPISLDSSITHSSSLRRLILYTCPRNLADVLYAASAADVLVCLFRGSSNTEPAFDEYGYKLLSTLRLQGLPTPVCVNLEAGLPGDRRPSSTLVRRYFHSEFGLDKKYTSVLVESDLRQVLSSIATVSLNQLSWRKDRGYMFSSNHSYDVNKSQLRLEGYVKGIGFSVHHPVHITSIGDFIINKIESLSDPCNTSTHNSSRMDVETVIEEQTEEIARELVAEVDCTNEGTSLESNGNGYDISNEQFENVFDKLTINRIPLNGNMEIDDSDSSIIDGADVPDLYPDGDSEISEDSEDMPLNENLDECNNAKKKIEFEHRDLEDLTFPDEVDTPVDVPARERFRKYRALKNIRTCVWDPYESLPPEYFQINEFENFRATMNESKAIVKRNCAKLNLSGSFIRLTLSNVSLEDYNKILGEDGTSKHPILLSTVLPLERKVSVLNFNVSRTPEGPDSVPSKTPLSLFCGFRRFPGKPIYSKTINVERGKRGLYERFFKRGDNCVASIYGMSISSPTPVIAINEAVDEEVIFGGNVSEADPSRIIIKRIILTGYPMRVHRKRAVVRYMFFNPSDIKYFKPAQLFTKRGLRGRILQSLGTHGHMKCIFSDFIVQDDIVCLALYKRVYPKWDARSWSNWI
ncbi:hypothetical protein BEWA_034630 [Theileria equi strain WA]|uniref:Uncharacterized protein n=1 Tax=Theileria equi strain WA TaxID=1537102 RepID=L0AYG1_THEEQ|nr:hypothetical protein BEWA_034630 [Theileria equi strain WA]AFZ80605.1 hypothetical protein BEWA_034630 [Theileria equi strain WA]|eukprot:XP_004830271.1 hypothetical protein BEWA_034630 [Theileria equi strain WA]